MKKKHIKEVVLRKSCDPAGAGDLRDVRDVKANCLSEKTRKVIAGNNQSSN